MKKIKVYASLVCLSAASAAQVQSFGSAAMRKLQMAGFAIPNFYVDKVDEDKLIEEAITKMLAQFDPRSTHLGAGEVKKTDEPLQGSFEDTGAQFQMIEGTLLVVRPVSNGLSGKVGILAGDRIIAVSDSVTAGVKVSMENIMKRLRGPKGSKVNLTIACHGVQDPLVFIVKRDKIPILSLDAPCLIQPKIGYIRINRFGATTAEELKKAMKDLQKQGMGDLVLDLQGNGGEYLNAAIGSANEFPGQKELIVYIEGRTAQRSELFAEGNGEFRNGYPIVLVDEYTVSASEIVSGAVQDWDRGTIVGRHSLGKGLVQCPIGLPDGSMIRLAVARYYTPADRCIQKPYDSSTDYNKDLVDRFSHGELMNADSIHSPNSLKVQTKKLKRTVYGGGSIMPDYLVPIDTTFYTDHHRKLVGRGVIIKFTMKFVEDHRKGLAGKYKRFDNFNEEFVIDDGMLATLREMGEKEGVKSNEEQYQKALPLIKTQLKVLIARDLWDINGHFCVMNTTNENVQKALEILCSGEYQEKLK